MGRSLSLTLQIICGPETKCNYSMKVQTRMRTDAIAKQARKAFVETMIKTHKGDTDQSAHGHRRKQAPRAFAKAITKAQTTRQLRMYAHGHRHKVAGAALHLVLFGKHRLTLT